MESGVYVTLGIKVSESLDFPSVLRYWSGRYWIFVFIVR